jgi:hypothetical protein
MTEQRNSQRRYKALEYGCPTCDAAPGEPCRTTDSFPLRGVHRRRDLVYNAHQVGVPLTTGSSS